jgi:hypothetical protein
MSAFLSIMTNHAPLAGDFHATRGKRTRETTTKASKYSQMTMMLQAQPPYRLFPLR